MSEIALPAHARFGVFNQTGITISSAPVGLPTITGQLLRYDSGGNVSYGATNVLFFSAEQSTLGNNSYATGSAFSNTASLWLGGDFLVSAFASGNASGTLTVFLEISPDGGTTWPTPPSNAGPGGGYLVATIAWASTTNVATASTTRRHNFSL